MTNASNKSSIVSLMATQEARQRFVYDAKLAEQAKRYEDMADAMKKVAKLGVELTAEERVLFSSSYKNMIDAKRDSWRILSSMDQEKKSNRNQQHARMIKEYLRQVESDISSVCNDVMAVIDEHLIPSRPCGVAFIFYNRMKGDYYRYLAELKSGTDRKEAAEKSCDAYQAATTAAESELSPAHPIRLSLALNFSVYHYEIMNSPERARDLARSAFDRALPQLDELSEERYKECATIMQLLKDNLDVWTFDLSDDGSSDV